MAEFSPEAIKVLGHIRVRLALIANRYGESSDEYREALESLAFSLMSVIGLGGEIAAEGELGLYGVGQIHYGMVFHANVKDGERDPIAGTWSVNS